MLLLVFLFCFTLTINAQTNPGCLRGWSYFEKSNKCYKVFGGRNDPIRPTTWTQAEQYCTTFNGGHLASFHSDDEITFVVGLSQRAPWDGEREGDPIHVGHHFVGDNKWEWTDGSHWTYTRWERYDLLDTQPGVQFQRPRGYLSTHRMWAATLWMAAGNDIWAFACQTPSSIEG